MNSCFVHERMLFVRPEGLKKLERLYPDTRYVNKLIEHSWGQKVVRFYDLDGNLIEVGTPM